MKPKKGFWKKALILPSMALLLSGCSDMEVLNPQGPVAKLQLELISWSFWILLGVTLTVFSLFAIIIYKYREKPENIDYEPLEQEGNRVLEIIWTAIPVAIIIALTIPTVMTTFKLEEVPKGYEEVEPVTIHVTSANWKWIFSYPEENIETVNYVNIPKGTPIKFKLTSAGPMNSFWVPQLGGQKYSMNNMSMDLFLVADKEGSFMGRSANFSGEHFTDMEFEVVSQSEEDYKRWIQDVRETAPKLTQKKYDEILNPGVVGRMTFNKTHLEWADHSKEVYVPGQEKSKEMNQEDSSHEHSNHDHH